MKTQKNESQKNSWDGEMKELFQKLRLRQDLKMSPLKHPYRRHELLRLPQPRLFRIWDISQKFLFIVNSMLIASPLDFNSAVWMAVLPNNALDPRHQPIFIGLRDGSRTLSCTLSNEGQPQLHLVERSIMELYNQNQKFLDFSFYSKTDGSLETCSFESAQFPGWFISTSFEPNKPISLGQKGGPGITLFYFETNKRKEKAELVITRIV
ncbi:interleukin-1 family member 10-like isoform X1 [Crotalus tigris]|uniref:interleukin-1 family member 10-like isoform X1 n=2 Tax=Crotalus tigris TaxID=88082 RepID=UPI00192F567F|nr:interleukin-1 family member 10-like isoform X1 [Crotalus tigris]